MRIRTAVYITLFVLAICLAIVLIVLWNIYIIGDYLTIRELQEALYGGDRSVPPGGRWVVLVLGITACVTLIVSLSLFFASVMRNNLFKKRQRDFTNMMTHELRLPLSGIQVFAQTLRQHSLDPEEHDRFVDGVLSECARLGQLIDQLLKIQQIEDRQLLMHRKVLDAASLTESFAAKWPRPLRLQAEKGLRIEADAALIETVLANLVSNAEKYGRGSVPELSLAREGRHARFAVRDGGKPLQRKYLKRIFRKFYRVPDLATRRQNGVGLGLYIVHSVARLHRGKAQAYPVQNPPGNEFSVQIPLVQS